MLLQKEKRTEIHVKNVVMMVLRGLSYDAVTDSESTYDWFERS